MKFNKLYYFYWNIKLHLFLFHSLLISDDTGVQLKLAMKYGIINNDLSPKHCIDCGHDKFITKIIDKINYEVCEIESSCDRCGKKNGYWSYGAWMP